MRLTHILFKQNLKRMFDNNWEVVKNMKIRNKNFVENLQSRGYEIVEANELFKEKDVFYQLYPEKVLKKIVEEKKPRMLTLADNDLLILGLNQAKILTNSIEMPNGLPTSMEEQIANDLSPDIIKLLKRYVLNSNVFYYLQEKLPRYKDPVRFFWKYPIKYGINEIRKCELLLPKLLQLCESMSTRHQDPKNGSTLVKDSKIITTFEYEKSETIIMDLKAELLMFTARPLQAIATPEELAFSQNTPLPLLDPLHPHISLLLREFPEKLEFFPVSNKCHHPHLHTAILFHDPIQVKNLSELEVKEEQILGRTLMKTFALARAQAKQRYGMDVQDLPEPIVIQSVLTDSRLFHFLVFQLNTLNVRDPNIKNIFWHIPRIPFYSQCGYVKAVPTLENLDFKVFNILSMFYNQDIKL